MARMTLKTLALALALSVLAGCAGSKSADRRGSTFIDNRDGKTYVMTTIGEQVWMAENLNYAMDSSWCYKNDHANCGKYGRLYTWDAAMKACPTGWHLPDSAEWDKLANTIGENAGTKLKTTSWGGTNEAEFFALPAGFRYYNADFYSMGSSAYFWTATKLYDSIAYDRYLRSDVSLLLSSYSKNRAYSVRCVKD